MENKFVSTSAILIYVIVAEIAFILVMWRQIEIGENGGQLFGDHMIWFLPISIATGIVSAFVSAIKFDNGSIEKDQLLIQLLLAFVVSILPSIFFYACIVSVNS